MATEPGQGSLELDAIRRLAAGNARRLAAGNARLLAAMAAQLDQMGERIAALERDTDALERDEGRGATR